MNKQFHTLELDRHIGRFYSWRIRDISRFIWSLPITIRHSPFGRCKACGRSIRTGKMCLVCIETIREYPIGPRMMSESAIMLRRMLFPYISREEVLAVEEMVVQAILEQAILKAEAKHLLQLVRFELRMKDKGETQVVDDVPF